MKTVRNFLKEWRKEIVIGVGILAIALFFRVYNLTYLPVFGDEAIYVRWAQVMKVESTLRFLPLSDGKQPLFMWSMIPFLGFFNDPVVAGRFISVITGLTSLIGIFALTYYLFKSKPAMLVAGLIYAISPYSMFFDRMALVDSMLTMFGIWTLLFSLIAVRTLRIDSAMMAGFTLGAALLTKSPALFFVVLLPLTALLSEWPKTTKSKMVHLGKLISLWGVTIIIGYAIYNVQTII
jgi:4-amino-4-deoxy-L-arabinose transferase-like glycosyltransferase